MAHIKKYSLTFVLVVAGAFIAVWTYSKFFDKPEIVTIQDTQALKYASLPTESGSVLPDLTYAAENSIHSVVHIMTQSMRGGWSSNNPLLDFFGYNQRQEPQIARGFGSGVILAEDGYIVTNNHVIEGAQKIKVVLNDKREFDARLIGTDPSTDIAVLKIESENLPYLKFGNSNGLKLGEWVLAVGNPFNLTSTVTAGIVSAMARNIGVNRSQDLSIESFIQTDAAVNPGNSGGALVNQNGELIGINTAIASRTGSYTGYSFAIPASIVQKVVADLKEFGEVQRALLGVNIGDVTAEIAERYDLDKIEGVFVGGVTDNGAAREAGIKEGDVIISVGGESVNSTAELQEKVSMYRPGDDVTFIVKRSNTKKQFTVTLRNKHGDTEIVRERSVVLGAEFEEISNEEKSKLNTEYGIKISKLNKGKLNNAGLKEGFIITDVNKKPIFEVNDFRKIIRDAQGGILIEGYYPNGEPAYFVFGIN